MTEETKQYGEPTPPPDIIIQCRSIMDETILYDIKKAMDTMIPTKYRCIEHDYSNGVHTLKYRWQN